MLYELSPLCNLLENNRIDPVFFYYFLQDKIKIGFSNKEKLNNPVLGKACKAVRPEFKWYP